MTEQRHQAKSMWLFTNRNCLVFDKDGNQIVKYQAAISCSTLDPEVAFKATEEAEEFHIGKFREWEHEINRDSMRFLLGIHPDYIQLRSRPSAAPRRPNDIRRP